jgi:hypothetical protein
MKSKKKPLVAAAISALLTLAGSASAQNTGDSTDRHTGTGRKVHRRVEKKGARYRNGRLESGKKASKIARHSQKGHKGGKKGKKSSGGTTTPPPK